MISTSKMYTNTHLVSNEYPCEDDCDKGGLAEKGSKVEHEVEGERKWGRERTKEEKGKHTSALQEGTTTTYSRVKSPSSITMLP